MRTRADLSPHNSQARHDIDDPRAIRAPRYDLGLRDRPTAFKLTGRPDSGQLCKVTTADGSVRWTPPRRGDLDFFAAPPPRAPRKPRPTPTRARIEQEYRDHPILGRVKVSRVDHVLLPTIHEPED